MREFIVDIIEFGTKQRFIVQSATARDAIDDAYGMTSDPDAEVIAVNPA